jgi:hypothetical protein
MLLRLDLLRTSSTLTVDTALPIARRRVSPTAPVTTTASRAVALCVIVMFTVAVAPLARFNDAVAG